jgi:phenylalanyl-tRNA synthetase beta chain
MLLSYNWLRELLPTLTASPSAIAEKLTSIGLELEEQREVGSGLELLRLVEVTKIEPHPNRDKLRLVTVNTGEATQTVVCGASNVPDPGGLVILAPLGAYLPAIDLKLEPRKLGGIVSEGMLCSEEELGLAPSADGILTFAPGTFKPGTPLYTAFPYAKDTIFGIGVTPNRPDALGHRGVARDLAAAFALDFAPAAPDFDKLARGAAALQERVSVRNEAPGACPRYGAALVDGVTVETSPEWLRWRLTSLGIRPISNVVDITNLVLLEFGNPMHAFDLANVGGGQIVIRNATAGERMTTLDGIERELVPTDLVIADAKRPTALAGIMGGRDSEIRETTKTVLLEAAYFSPSGVRKSARRLAMHTDSSYRFERGVNWLALEDVLARASQLLSELASGTPIGAAFFDGAPPLAPEVRLRSARVNQLLGVDVPFSEVCAILGRLGFTQVSADAATQSAVFAVPAWRPDVSIEADLIEEVARIRGLDAIPAKLPSILPQVPSASGRLEREVRKVAAGLGLDEAVSYSFVSPKDLAALGAPASVVTLNHPLSEERSVMTTSLLPGLLEAYRRSSRHGHPDLRLFTVGSKFLPVRRQLNGGAVAAARTVVDADVDRLPEERFSFAALLAGERANYLSKAEPLDVYDAKGVVVELIARLTGQSCRLLPAPSDQLAYLHPRSRANIEVAGQLVGSVGALHPNVAEKLDVPPQVFVIELCLDTIENLGSVKKRYRPIPRLPAVTRDIALEASEQLTAGDILATMKQNGGELCESVELFDLYTGSNLEPGRRSLAFRLTYRDPKAVTDPEKATTLTDKQVDKQHAMVVAAVQKLGVTIRA